MELRCMFVVVFARNDACIKNSSKYTSQKSESYSMQNLKNNKKEKKVFNSALSMHTAYFIEIIAQ